jgi:hypothetical protein
MLRPPYSGIELRYQPNKRLCGPRKRPGGFSRSYKYLAPIGIRTSDRPSISVVITPTRPASVPVTPATQTATLVNSVVGTLVTKGTPDGSKKNRGIWSYA